jgi:NitT/TauT family transport system permease protein
MRSYAAGIVFAALFFLAWEAAVRGFDIPAFVAPAPSAILKALVAGFAEANYLGHCLVTVGEALSGFVLGAALGISAGILIVISPVMEKVIYPWIVALQSMPKVAIAPLLVVWFGFGLASKVVVVTLVTLFPVLVNVVAGLRNVEQERLDLMLGLSASRWQVMRYLRLPNALPFIFAGLNTAIVFSITAAIVGEFVGATKGLGYLILQANYSLDIAAVFALLIVLAGVGILLHSLVQFAESRIVFWSKSEDMNPGAP